MTKCPDFRIERALIENLFVMVADRLLNPSPLETQLSNHSLATATGQSNSPAHNQVDRAEYRNNQVVLKLLQSNGTYI